MIVWKGAKSLSSVAGSSATAWNIYSYDTYDRLTAISEPSGRKTTHGYSGNSITTVEDGISVKRTYDALGNLISVVDPAGTITYNLRPDGQPSSIVAPGNVTTSFGYDGFGRRLAWAILALVRQLMLMTHPATY